MRRVLIVLAILGMLGSAAYTQAQCTEDLQNALDNNAVWTDNTARVFGCTPECFYPHIPWIWKF